IEPHKPPVFDSARGDKDRPEAAADRRRKRDEVLAGVEARRRLDAIPQIASSPAAAPVARPAAAAAEPAKPSAPAHDTTTPTRQRLALAAYSIPALVKCSPSMQPVPGG